MPTTPTADEEKGDMPEFCMGQQQTSSTASCPNSGRPQRRTTQQWTTPTADGPNDNQPQGQTNPTAITHMLRIQTVLNSGKLFENIVVL